MRGIFRASVCQEAKVSIAWAVQAPDYSERILDALSKPEQNDPGSQNHLAPNQSSIANSQYISVGLNLNWELDLWGKKKHDALATLAAYQESQATYRGEYLKLAADAAQTYFEIRQKDRDIRINRKIYDDTKKRLAVYQQQYSEGLIPQWKVSRQKTETDNAEKELSDLSSQRKISENKLAILLNKVPGKFSVPESGEESYSEIVRVPAGIPSELMTRRPDIIASAYRVLKAHNRLGESRAALLPSVSLTGSGSLASAALSNLLKQWTLGITPSLSFPIFDGGAARIKAESNELQLKIAEDEYRKTVMKAFEEVENTLNNLENRIKQKAILEEKTRTMRQIYEQTMARFDMGLLSQLEVLDITRELYAAEISLSATHKLLSDDTVTLYKALGGGWSVPNIRIEELAVVDHQQADKRSIGYGNMVFSSEYAGYFRQQQRQISNSPLQFLEIFYSGNQAEKHKAGAGRVLWGYFVFIGIVLLAGISAWHLIARSPVRQADHLMDKKNIGMQLYWQIRPS
ncbi:MAG: efflux transporter outer membrane subunit [Desulfobacteraceae bacterium]|nr:efflux transporter outer membrane subunit [Desulfobacteraceae bacterium]